MHIAGVAKKQRCTVAIGTKQERIRNKAEVPEMIMKIYFVLTFLFFVSLEAFSQELPIHNQFFMNPYVYNPAYVGHDGYSVLYLSHRRQWMGIEGAPVSSNLSFHTQLKKTLAVGLNVYTEKRGLLTTSSAELALGYKVKIGEEHYIQFGLAGGVGSNNIDLSELQNISTLPYEPSAKGMYPEARFGIKYHIKNLNLGLALPTLFQKDYISDKGFGDVEANPLEQYLGMISYRFELSKDNLAFEPHFVYRALGNDFTYMEGTGVFYIKNLLWAGASYRMDYGLTGLGGVKIKDLLTIGYAYELAASQVAGYVDGSHEIQLSIKLGQKKTFETKEKISRPRFDTQTESY